MAWWGWALITWAAVATLAAGWLATSAGIARKRERALRGRQYQQEAAAEQRHRKAS